MTYYTIINTQTKEVFTKEFLNEEEAYDWVKLNLNSSYDYLIEYNYKLNTPN